MPCIEVGINEWAIMDRTKYYNFSLWTNGLNGFVAVAIVTNTHAFLAHIDRRVSLSQWDYEVSINFLAALKNLGPLPSNATCEVVLRDDHETKLSWAVYQTIYTKWKESEAAINSEPEMSYPYKGLRIFYPSFNKFALLKSTGHKSEWGVNKNTITGEKYVKYKGLLTDKSKTTDI